jgi:hypothetical protein
MFVDNLSSRDNNYWKLQKILLNKKNAVSGLIKYFKLVILFCLLHLHIIGHNYGDIPALLVEEVLSIPCIILGRKGHLSRT